MRVIFADLRSLQDGVWALVRFVEGERTLTHQFHCRPRDWDSLDWLLIAWPRAMERVGRELLRAAAHSEPDSPLPCFSVVGGACELESLRGREWEAG